MWLCPAIACTNTVVTDTVCVDCYEYLHVQLADVPVLWARARTLLPKVTHAPSEKVSVGLSGSMPPLRLGILDVMETSAGTLNSWVVTLGIRCGLDLSTMEADVSAACDWLDLHVVDLVGSPLLITFYNDVFGVHRALIRVAGDDPELVRLIDPCPTCHNVALIKKRNDDYVRCLTCSNQWGQAAYQGLRRRASLPRPVPRYAPQGKELHR